MCNTGANSEVTEILLGHSARMCQKHQEKITIIQQTMESGDECLLRSPPTW